MSIKLVDTQDIIPAVAIVGAGASGTLLASHLLARGQRARRADRARRAHRARSRVRHGVPRTLLERPRREHERAARDPEHFLRFARGAHDPATEPTTFVPRRVYGEYLSALLAESHRVAAPGASLMRRRGEVADLRAGPGPGPLADDIRRRLARARDRVVLALGNLPPRDPAPGCRRLARGSRPLHPRSVAPGRAGPRGRAAPSCSSAPA